MKHLKNKILILVLAIASIVAITINVYAYISRISTRGEIEVSAATVTAETTYTATGNSFDWTYTEAGDIKQINITTNNQTGTILHRFYNIELASGFTSNQNLLKAIIVYYNDTYIGVLNDIITTNPKIEEEFNFIGLSSNKTDNFKFELHQAAVNSIFDNKDIKVTITTYTENADFLKYIFVNNESDFKKAIDDCNSGLFAEVPSIVLCNNITLQNSYTISEPVTIYLNGSTLNGSLTLNDTTTTNPNALLEVLGNGTFNVTVTLGANYDTTGAATLVKNYIKEVLSNGVAAPSTTNILGYYSFYGISVTALSRCTFTSPNVIIGNTSNEYYSQIASIRVNSDEDINFKVLGSKTTLIDQTLAHMPEEDATISLDLFLPTYIPSQNASITWTSSDESIITSTGKITAERLENASVTLYAEIKVNNTVITRKYRFKVSAHNNEINFYKLVQEISPIVINNVRNSQADDPDALYHLPIVNENNGVYGNYDYRTSYTSPTNTEMFNWVAYRNIGLENITYSMSQEQQTNFDYITLTNTNELYLNNITLNNYASITITGDFGNSETYSTNINISISVGSNTQLLERTFTNINEELSHVSVLGNILSTRISSGMANEKGDFSLSHKYLDPDTNEINEDYTVEYSGASDIIASITYNSVTDKYDFTINPEYFNEYETTVAFTATVYYRKNQTGETSKSRTFYVTVPAALHLSDFGTISIYNSTKYQVFTQLPSNEKNGTTGYTVSGSTLTDNNLNYILLRDIVGDANYLSQYNNNNLAYLEKINYSVANYCLGTQTLSYQTSSTNPTTTTDTQAYDFARLIEWATGNTRVAASTVVSNTTALGTLASTKANAEDYLNNDEIAVLKQYYKYCTGTTNAQWESLFSEVFEVAPGYIYTNPALLNTVIKLLNNNSISWIGESYSTLFGKYMEILQRYAVSTTMVNAHDVAPCQEQYNSTKLWYHSSQSGLTSFQAVASNGRTYTSTVEYTFTLKDGTYWYRGSRPSGAPKRGNGDGDYGGFYATDAYAADRTSYITAAELQVLMMFWLNTAANNLNTNITTENSNTIQSVLTANSIYYSKYTISDFNTVGKAIINAFDACMEIPTYFSTDGVSKLIKSFYDKKNYSLPTYDVVSNTSFVSSLNGSIPYITNGDNIKSVLSYFVNLTSLTFNGNTNLAVFLSENGLSTVFARTGLYNTLITNLTMKHVAHSSVNFDLTNIKNFKNLTVLDLSNNTGIQSVNELVNVNRSNYTSVNIENIGVEYDYQEFAIDNIASPTCTVRYTNSSSVNTSSNGNSRASELAELSDFNKFITKYMYMTNVVYDEDGNETQITWRIDEGNEINKDRITNGGNYPSISTIDEMNQFISPYYYCTQAFTYSNLSFESGKYYRVYYENNTLKRQLLGECISSNSLSVSNAISQLNIDTSVPASSEFSGETYNTEITTTRSVVSGTESTYDTYTWYNNNTTNVFNVNWTITNTYIIQMKRDSHYIYCNNISNDSTPNLKLASSENSSDASQFFFLDHETVVNVLKKKYTDTVNLVGYKYNEITDSNMYHMCVIYDSNLYCVGSIQDYVDENTNDVEISITNNISDLLYISYNSSMFTFSNSKNLRMNASHLPSYHKQADQTGIKFTVSTTINQTVPRSSFIKVNYTNGESEYIDAYAVGYRVYHVTNAVLEYVDTETTEFLNHSYEADAHYMYYTGSNATIYDENGNSISIKPNTILKVYANYKYPVTTRSRSYFLSGDFYIWKLWYITNTTDYNDFNSGNVDASGYIFGDLIQSVKLYYGTWNYDETAGGPYYIPTDTVNSNTPGDDWDDWLTPLTSTWEYDSIYFSPYITYVSSMNQDSHDLLENQSNYYSKISTSSINHLYRYSGTTDTITVYKGSSGTSQTTYNNNYGYKLVVSNNQLAWQQYSTSLSNPSGTKMDTLINTANSHFGDFHYGEYYGKYYGYSGPNFYSEKGYYYETGYIYRIMPNETNTGFTWVKVCPFTTTTPSDMLLQLGTGLLGVDDIVYGEGSNAFDKFFSQGWYKVVLDEKTNIVNLVKFNDVGFTTNGAKTYTKLTNDKLVGRNNDYLGYSGTFTIQISALIRVKDNSTGLWTEYIKTYKLKFVGSLTS